MCAERAINGLLKVSLDIRQYDNHVCFDCAITNIGTIDIALGNTYLFVDKGVFLDRSMVYTFPFIQKKFLEEPDIAFDDCVMSAYCKKGNSSYPLSFPHISKFYEENKITDPFVECFVLPHLSSSSVLHMAPTEKFNEEIVVRFEKGVYRAILVSVPKNNSCDCMCSNRCFIIN